MIYLSIPRKTITLALGLFLSLFCIGTADAQELARTNVSLGVMLGDPLGVTLKYCVSSAHAFDFSFGPDYFGSPRLQIDDIWEWNTFRNDFIRLYAGPGLAIAFGNGKTMLYSHEPGTESFENVEDKGFEFGGRAIFGMNLAPRWSAFEFFFEAGPLVALTRAYFDVDLDAGIGMRYRL